MAYGNFKPTVWSKYIQHELEQKAILSEWCNKKFEGEAKHNKTVKVLGVGKPTIGNYTGAKIGAPETLEDTSVFLTIDQAKFFNFMVDDVDRAQSIPGLMEALMQEATRAMAGGQIRCSMALMPEQSHKRYRLTARRENG